jgi:histidinol dehydrogenase
MSLISRLSTKQADFEQKLAALIAFETAQDPTVDERVADILEQVRREGDTALWRLTQELDHWQPSTIQDLEIPMERCDQALSELDPVLHQALEQSCARIRHFHEHQRQQSWSYAEADGSLYGQRITPLDRVGLYVPGGKAVYPSSVLMNAIPAQVAGVGEILMVVPTPKGFCSPLVLAAAALAGVTRVFAVGGAQAIGALAYGTDLIPAVDKIVGPGNAYVAAAKRRVFGVVGIDMVAGPSEILIIADGTTAPEWVAMDLFSQAEHDEMAQGIILCPDLEYLDRVSQAIERLLPTMSRQAVIRESLRRRGALIEVADLAQACHLANRIAPEHLELSVDQPQALLEHIVHAGAIFVGAWTSEALGDYCAGPNHVLPTSRTARFASPLGVYDFQKRSSLIQVSAEGAQTLGRIAGILADGEGLSAHAQSARLRCTPIKG